MILIIKYDFDNMENRDGTITTIVGYVDNDAQADSYIECHDNEKKYRGWNGEMYPKYTKKQIHNLYSTPTEDGVYAEFFAVQNGKRYTAKSVNLRDMSKTLTNGLMDGLEKLIGLK